MNRTKQGIGLCENYTSHFLAEVRPKMMGMGPPFLPFFAGRLTVEIWQGSTITGHNHLRYSRRDFGIIQFFSKASIMMVGAEFPRDWTWPVLFSYGEVMHEVWHIIWLWRFVLLVGWEVYVGLGHWVQFLINLLKEHISKGL